MKFVVSFLAVLPALCSAFSVSPFSSVATSQRSSLLMAEEGMGEIIPHDFDPPMHRIEGGDTLLTWKMPPGSFRQLAECCHQLSPLSFDSTLSSSVQASNE